MVFRKLFHTFGLLFVSVAVCLLCVDIVIVVSGLDIAWVKKTIYTVEGDFRYSDGGELYRDSQDTEILYELIPGATAKLSDFYRHSKDIDKTEITFSIDRFGFRSNGGPERTKKKPDGVFRIIVLGGSNTFGPLVSDFQTWPAQLEKALNKKAPGRVEVWNAGLNAYNMTQKVVYADRLIKEYDPDLLLFQQVNTGRRAFFYKAQYAYFFRRNRDLWRENAPLIWFGSDPAGRLHGALVRNWALYRLCVCAYNNYLVDSIITRSVPAKARLPEFERTFNRYFAPFADRLASKLFFGFVFSCQREDTVRTAMIVNAHGSQESLFVSGLPLFFIREAGQEESRPQEFFDIHPPSQVYEWYGGKIADWLVKEKLVPDE